MASKFTSPQAQRIVGRQEAGMAQDQDEAQRAAEQARRQQQAEADQRLRDAQRLQQEQLRAQEDERERNVRRAVSQGVETTTDVQTGKRTIARHADGAPKYEAGPLGGPKPIGESVTAIKQPGQAEPTPVPNMGIMMGGDPEGSANTTGASRQAVWGQEVRDDRGNVSLVKPQTETNKETGAITFDRKDPVTGQTVQQQVGTDNKVIQDRVRAEKLAYDQQNVMLRRNQLNQAKASVAPEFEPVDKEFKEAESQLKDAEKAAARYVTEQRKGSDGKERTTTYYVNETTGKKNRVEPYEVEHNRKRMEAAKMRMAGVRAKYDPLKARQDDLQGQADQLEAQSLKLAEEKNRIELGLPEADGGVAAFLAKEKGEVERLPYDRGVDAVAGGNEFAENPPQEATQERQSSRVAGPLIPPGQEELVKSAFPAVKDPEGLEVEQQQGWMAVNKGKEWIASIKDGGGSRIMVVRPEGAGDVSNLVNAGETKGVPLYLQDNPQRKPYRDEANELAGIFTAIRDLGGVDTVMSDRLMQTRLEQMGATPQQIKQRVSDGTLSLQNGEVLMRNLYRDTLAAEDPNKPELFNKWLAEQTKKERASYQKGPTTGEKWASASKGTGYSHKAQNDIRKDYYADWYQSNAGKPGVTRAKALQMMGEDVSDRASGGEKAASVATAARKLAVNDVIGSMFGLAAGAVKDIGAAEMALFGNDEAAAELGRSMGMRNRDFANFATGAKRNAKVWATKEGAEIRGDFDKATGNLQRTINEEMDKPNPDKAAIDAAETAVRQAALKLHGLAPDPEWPITEADLDPNQDSSLGNSLARFVARADPREFELYKDRLLMSNGRRQFSAEMEKLSKRNSMGDFGASVTGGMNAGWQELGTELLADAGIFVTAGGSKAAQIGLRGAGAVRKAAQVERLGSRIAQGLSNVARVGEAAQTLTKPLTGAQRAGNAVVRGGKTILKGSVGEGLEEVVSGMGADTPDLLTDFLMGAAGGVVLAPIQIATARAGEQRNAAQVEGNLRQQNAQFANRYNSVMAGTPGFTPINPETAGAARALINPQEFQANAEKVMLAKQNFDQVAAMPEPDPKVEAQASSMRGRLNALEGRMETAPEAQRTAMEGQAAAMRERLADLDSQIGQSSGGTESRMRAAKELNDAVSGFANQNASAVAAASEIQGVTDPARKTFLQGVAKVATGQGSLLTQNERSAITGATTEGGQAYFANVNGVDVMTDEGRAEVLANFPSVGSLIQTTESTALATPPPSNVQQPAPDPSQVPAQGASVELPVSGVPAGEQGAAGTVQPQDARDNGDSRSVDGGAAVQGSEGMGRGGDRNDSQQRAIPPVSGVDEGQGEASASPSPAQAQDAPSEAQTVDPADPTPAIRAIEKAYPKLKGKIKVVSDPLSDGAYHALPDGIYVNTEKLGEDLADFAEGNRTQRFNDALDEEIVHYAGFEYARQEAQKAWDRMTPEEREFLVRGWWNGTTPEIREMLGGEMSVEDMFATAYSEILHEKLWKELSPKDQKWLADIYGGFDSMPDWAKGGEAIRMMVQQARNGSPTERGNLAAIGKSPMMRKILQAALDYLTDFVKGRKASPVIQDAMDGIQAILDGFQTPEAVVETVAPEPARKAVESTPKAKETPAPSRKSPGAQTGAPADKVALFKAEPVVAGIIRAGGMQSKSDARKSNSAEWMEKNAPNWDDAPIIPPAFNAEIYRPGSPNTPDKIAQALQAEGIGDGTVNSLWKEIERAANAARDTNKTRDSRQDPNREWTGADIAEYLRENGLSAANSVQRIQNLLAARANRNATAQDKAYMAAVESGDMETAQRMVDEAAKAAGYNVGPVYHGTNQKFDTFDPNRRASGTSEYGEGFMFFTDSEELASEYSQMGSADYRESLADLGKAEQKYEDAVFDVLGVSEDYERNRYHNAALNRKLDKGEITKSDYDRVDQAFVDVYDLRKKSEELRDQDYQPIIQRVFLDLDSTVLGKGTGNGMLASWDVINTALAKEAVDSGANGFIAENVIDSPFDSETPATIYAVRKSNQIKSADPVTRDSEGNVIPLSQRFNPSSNSILYAAPANREPGLPQQVVDRIVQGFSPVQRAIVAATLRPGAPSAEGIAREVNAMIDSGELKGETGRPINEKAVANIMDQVFVRIRALTEAGKAPGGLAPQMEGGKLKEGRSDRAMTASSPDVARVQQIRAEEGVPDVVSNADVYAEADKMIREDRQGTLDRIINRRRNGEVIPLVELAAAQRLLLENTGKLGTPEEQMQMAWLAADWIDQGTDDARRLQIRKDTVHTPAERAALYFTKEINIPSDPTTLRELSKAKSSSEREAILKEWMRKRDALIQTMKNQGIDLLASLEQFQRERQEQKQIEAERPRTTEVINLEVKKLPDNIKAGIQTLLTGGTYESAALTSNSTVKEIEKAYSKFYESISDAMDEAAAKFIQQALSAAKALSKEEILNRLGVFSPAAVKERSLPPEKRKKAKGQAQKAPAQATPEQQAKWDKMAEEFFARPPSEWRTLWQNEMPGVAWPKPQFDELEALAETKPRKQAFLDLFQTKINEIRGTWNETRPFSGQGEFFRQPINETTGLLDFNDPLQVKQVQDEFAITKSTAWDKVAEFWKASILTGPQSHVVNTASNLMNATYNLLPKRAVEAAVNNILGLVGLRAENGASFGEFKPLLSQFHNAMVLGARQGLKAWKTENRLFDAYTAGKPMQVDFTGLGAESIPPSIGGPVGTIMRGLSFRAMTAVDEFIKHGYWQMEVAAQAHRIAAVQEKLKGKAYEARLAELMKPGSEAAAAAATTSRDIAFQDPVDPKGQEAIRGLDVLADYIKKSRNLPWIGKPMTFVVPFVDTPLAIFKQAIQVTPIGGFLALVDASRALAKKIELGKISPEQAKRSAAELYNRARFVKDLTNQTIGLMTWLAVQEMVVPDEDDELPMLTGTMPFDASKAGERANARTVMPPMTIRIVDTQLSYARFEPFATVLGSLADMAVISRQKGGFKPAAVSEWFGRFKDQIGEKTFLQGIGNLLDALAEPERFAERYAAGIVTGFVPNVIRQPLREVNDVARDTGPREEDGFFEGFSKSLGYSIVPQAAPEKMDVWGREIPVHRGQKIGNDLTDALVRIFDPTNVAVNPDLDPLDRWIYLYNQEKADSKDRIGIQPIGDAISATVDGKPKQIPLTVQEQRDANREAGQMAREALGDGWDEIPRDEEGKQRILDVVQQAQKAERARIRLEKLADMPFGE